MIEAGANRAAGREAGGSLAPENDPPLASAQDLIRQVSMPILIDSSHNQDKKAEGAREGERYSFVSHYTGGMRILIGCR